MTKKKVTIRDCMDKMTDLLLIIDKTCKKLKIEYWIDGGTLLGAVRQEGYIPWDDDVDVCLMYDDFVVLTKRLSEIAKNHETLICYNDHRPKTYWTDNFGDISILKDALIPVKIDIIPFKSIKNTAQSIAYDRSIINNAMYFQKGKYKNKSEIINEHLSYVPNSMKDFSAKKKIFYDYFLNEYLPSNSKLDPKNLYNYAFNDAMVKKNRSYYKYDDIFPLKKITFENYSFPCPNNVNGYLTILYGENFITPPKLEDRIPYAYNNFVNVLPKSLVEQRFKLHFDRENKLGFARASFKPIRYFYKFITFIALCFKSICLNDWKFLKSYFLFSVRHFIN